MKCLKSILSLVTAERGSLIYERLCGILLVGFCMTAFNTLSYASGFAPRNVHESVWNGQFAPNTPETLSMLHSGDERHDLYNGMVNMEVPIYTWKDNLFEIPVSLKYSYSGLKPGFTESSVGLGWFLNAGGVITRKVRGIPDENYNVFFPAYSFLQSAYSDGLSNPEEGGEEDPGVEDAYPGGSVFFEPGSPYGGWTLCGFLGLYNGNFDSSVMSSESNSAAFIYSGSLGNEFTMGMSLEGASNRFRCVELEPDIFDFSFMGYSGSFILQPDHHVLILDSATPAGEMDIEFHCDTYASSGNGSYFIITTGDRVKYKFETRVYSSSIERINGSDYGGENDLLSSWKLTEILHPSGHRVIFNYEDYIMTNYSAAKSRDHLSVDNGCGIGSGYLPVNNWQNPESYSENSLSLVAVHEKLLAGIEIENRGHMDFMYSDGLLTNIKIWVSQSSECNARLLREVGMAYYTPYSMSLRGSRCTGINFLESVTLSGVGTYDFLYDSADDQHFFPDASHVQGLYCTDWYGYYNGNSYASAYAQSSLSIRDLAQRILAIRNTYSLVCARMGAMTRVTYPTGGYSTFEYESNRYGQMCTCLSAMTGGNAITAGIRLCKIRVFDTDNTQLQERNLAYALQDGRSSGVLLQPVTLDDIHYDYSFDNQFGDLRFRVKREACSPLLDIGFTRDFHVEYLRVIEEVRENSLGPIVAKTEHRFQSASPYIDVTGLSVEGLSQSSRFSEDLSSVFSMNDMSRHLPDWRMCGSITLAGRETFTKYHAVQSGESSYEIKTEYSFYTLDRVRPDEEPEDVDSADVQRPFYGLTMLGGYVYERRYEPRLSYVSCVTTTLNEGTGSPFVGRTELDVNKLGQIRMVRESAVDGGQLNTYYTYSPQAPSLITSVTRRRGTTLISKEELSYMPLDVLHSSCLVPSICKVHAVDSQGLDCGMRTVFSFDLYDSWCNPGIITDASMRASTWVWGYNGLHPISCTISDGVVDYRTTSWTWIPTVGVASVTNPSGIRQSFDYDEYGRLIRKRDNAGFILEEYMYNTVSAPNPLGALTLTMSKNFISVKKCIDDGVFTIDVQYYDGIGRESQRIFINDGGTPSAVRQTIWDPLGRKVRDYLPFEHNSSGVFVDDWLDELTDYYSTSGLTQGNDPLFYSVSYERRLDGRSLSHSLPGSQVSSHPTLLTYRTNSASEVRKYSYSTTSGSVSSAGFYASGALSVVRTEDGDGHVIELFMDKEGREVCEKKYLSASQVACTCKVYDDAGRIVWVISPEGYAEIGSGTVCPGDERANKWCYVYTYDEWGRLISKSFPGREPEYMVYDIAGRVVLSQDGNLRNGGKWLKISYNVYDEITERSIIHTTASRDQLQAMFPVNGFCTFNGDTYVTDRLELRQYNGTNLQAFIPSELAFKTEYGVVSSILAWNGRARLAYEELTLSGEAVSRPRPLEMNAATGQSADTDTSLNPSTPPFARLIKRAYYYDNEGRTVQTVEKNQLGGISRISFRYDHAGNILECVERHTTGEIDATQDVKHSLFQYDSRGHLIAECASLNGGEVSFVEHEYNGIGQIVSTLYGDVEYGIRQDFAYTLQGWMASTRAYDYNNQTIFEEIIGYDNPIIGHALFTGNISCVSSTQSGTDTQTRAYEYDALGRLTSSVGNSGALQSRLFTEQGISYDNNGNILALQRYGADDDIPEEDLVYRYEGNRLVELECGNGESVFFNYDANGNMTYDGLRDLTIVYNYLNLPQSITSGESAIGATFTYASDRTKRSVGMTNGLGYEYLGTMVYSKDILGYTLESASFSGGRLVSDGVSTVARYYLTDHLGSVRCVVHGEEGDGSVVYEQNDYYPFGMRMLIQDNVQSSFNRWRFSGKEEQSQIDATILDFGARLYDSRIARWVTQDPFAEKYFDISTYGYCHCNPLNMYDIDGCADWRLILKGLFNMLSGGAQFLAIADLEAASAGAATPAMGLWAIESAGTLGLGAAYFILGLCVTEGQYSPDEIEKLILSPTDAFVAGIAEAMKTDSTQIRHLLSFIRMVLSAKKGNLYDSVSAGSALWDMIFPYNLPIHSEQNLDNNQNMSDHVEVVSDDNTSKWKYYESWDEFLKDYNSSGINN